MLGFMMVFVTYIIIGTFGYIGFSGVYFEQYLKAETAPIAQNCLQMFDHLDIIAFFLRIVVFFLMFSSMPILAHFARSGIINIIWGGKEMEDEQAELFVEEKRCCATITPLWYNLISGCIITLPFCMTVFYPNIGVILSYVGAIFGFLNLYLLPIITYLKKLDIESSNPILARADKIHSQHLEKKYFGDSSVSSNRTHELQNQMIQVALKSR